MPLSPEQPILRGELAISEVAVSQLRQCEDLYRRAFGLTTVEALPAWVIMTTDMVGGVTLGAFDADRLVAMSYAFPAFDGREPYLYSCGLIVRPEYQGKGLGRRLKLVQRERALQAGYRYMRWTTGSLNVRALYLYLNRLGARAVGLLPDMLDSVIEGTHADEIQLEWDLAAPTPRAAPAPPEDRRWVLTESEPAGVLRALVHAEGHPASIEASSLPVGVELPWDQDALLCRPDLTREWRMGVRESMLATFAAKRRGVAVDLDRTRRRVFVWFPPPDPEQPRDRDLSL